MDAHKLPMKICLLIAAALLIAAGPAAPLRLPPGAGPLRAG